MLYGSTYGELGGYLNDEEINTVLYKYIFVFTCLVDKEIGREVPWKNIYRNKWELGGPL